MSQGQDFSQTRAGNSCDDDEMNDETKIVLLRQLHHKRFLDPLQECLMVMKLSQGKLPQSQQKDQLARRCQPNLQKRGEKTELETLEELTKSLNEPASENTDMSEIDSFCQYISKSLNKFDEKTKNIVKNGIQNLIFQTVMGNAIQ